MYEEILEFGNTEVIITWSPCKVKGYITSSARFEGSIQLCTGGSYSVYLYKPYGLGRARESGKDLKDTLLSAMRKLSQAGKLCNQMRFM